MKCPSCNESIIGKAVRCEKCGFIAPAAKFFANDRSFSEWKRQSKTINFEPEVKKEECAPEPVSKVATQPTVWQKPREVVSPIVQNGARKKASVFGTVMGWIISSILFLVFLSMVILLTAPQETAPTIILIVTSAILFLQFFLINPLLSRLIPSVPVLRWIKSHRIRIAAILAGVWFVLMIVVIIAFSDVEDSSQFDSRIDEQKIEEITTKWKEDGNVDYTDINKLEQDLKGSARFEGTTVTFKVTAVRELTELGIGYAIEGGNSIVFISREKPEVKEGETITVIVSGVTYIIGGGYRISYVILGGGN
jgi:hypothetical protein